jgi:type IV secretion system protein VirB5
MKKTFAHFFICLVLVTPISVPTNAQIPTTDIINFIQNLLGYLEQLEGAINQVEQLENQYRQLENAGEMLESVRGARDLANLLNSEIFKRIRRDLPNNPRDVIRGLQNGDIIDELTEAYRDILGDVIDVYDVLDVNNNDDIRFRDLQERHQQLKARQIAVQTNAISSSYAAVEVSANNLQTAEELIDQIDTTEDLKASLDLNSRILGEVLIQLNQQIKMQGTSEISKQEGTASQLQKQKLMMARYNIEVEQSL